jgi:hypothetical protein
VLLADGIVEAATWLATSPADKEAAAALRKERRRVHDSTDWFDELIVERMQLDAERKAQP